MLQITFQLTVKHLMSFDLEEWTESLMKEYNLVVKHIDLYSIASPNVLDLYCLYKVLFAYIGSRFSICDALRCMGQAK